MQRLPWRNTPIVIVSFRLPSLPLGQTPISGSASSFLHFENR
jgi:hypothetical protein